MTLNSWPEPDWYKGREVEFRPVIRASGCDLIFWGDGVIEATPHLGAVEMTVTIIPHQPSKPTA